MAKEELDSVPCLNLTNFSELHSENEKNYDQISPATSIKSATSNTSTVCIETEKMAPLPNSVSFAVIEDDDNSSLVTDSEDENDDCMENKENPMSHDSLGLECEISSNVLALTSAYHDKISNLDHNTPRSNIALADCENITIGNKIFYNGPVTIMLDKDSKSKVESDGVINPGFYMSEKHSGIYNESQSTHIHPVVPQNGSDQQKFKLPISRKNLILTALASIAALSGIILLSTTLLYTNKQGDTKKLGDGDDSRKNIAINSTIGQDLITGNKVIRMVSRDEWLAQPPAHPLDLLELPAKRVVITHTASEPCDTQAACTFRTRTMQTFHMESRGWDDVAYNFMIGGDGSVYEGRGWDKQGAHTKGYNRGSIGIAYIGTFITNLPNEKQLIAGFLLMKEGVKLGKLKPDYRIYAHRQLIPSESPGFAFYEIIKTWPHWSSENPDI